MAITITTHNTLLTPALQDYVEKRLGNLGKFTAGDPVVAVDLGVVTAHHRQGEIFEVKVDAAAALGKNYHVVSQKGDMYEAIDDARNQIVRLLTTAKDKNTTLFRRGAQKIKNLLRGFRS